MIKRVSILTLLFVLLVSLVSAVPEEVESEDIYASSGGDGFDFIQGPGGFDAAVLATTVTKALGDGAHHPLIADLDGDGIREIIIVDDGTIRLYNNPSLDVVDAISLTAGDYSPPIVNDVDKDGFLEILIVQEGDGKGDVFILKYNGTDFFIQNTIEYTNVSGYPTSAGGGTFENLIQCGDDQGTGESISCYYVLFRSQDGSGARKIFGHAFNASERSATALDTLSSDSNSNTDLCMPNVPFMTYADFDADNRKEFIFSAAELIRFSGDNIKIFYIDVGEDLTRNTDLLITHTSGFDPSEEAGNCETDNLGKYYTSPLVSNLDDASGNGLETVIGASPNGVDYQLQVFSSVGSNIREHPFLFFTTDGDLLGNPMLANVFGDTGANDYCVMGQDQDEQLLKLLCGSMLTGHQTLLFISQPDVEFGFDITDTFNLTDAYNNPSSVGHMSNQVDGDIQVYSDLPFTETTELVSAHGVFQLTGDDFTGVFTGKQMNRIFQLQNVEAACTVFDVQDVGAADIMCVRDTAVTYTNDNLVNGPAAITSFTENPCIDAGPVKINSTMQIKIVAVDTNDEPLIQDLVTTRVTLYAGSSNEQVSELANQTSGIEQIHLFESPGGLNKTGSVNIKYEAFDTENPSEISDVEQTFAVGTAGVEFGDCESGQDIALPGEEDEPTAAEELAAAIPDDRADNGVTTGIITLSNLLGLGGTTIWLIIMIALSIGVWGAVMRTGPDGHPIVHGSSALGMIAILNLLMIIIGARLGILSTALVVIIVIVAVVVIGVFLGKFLTGLKAAGGE